MKIQYMSDLHLEYVGNRDYLMSHLPVPCGDILVLAGDIGYLGPQYKEYPFWDWASRNYRMVIVGPGNHEFYDGYDLAKMRDGERMKIRKNVFFYYNGIIHLDDIDIIISPLWSHIKKEKVRYTEFSVTDFHRIIYNGHKLTADDFNREHERCLAFIRKAVSDSTAKTKIVATHHVPSFKLVTEWFAGHGYIGAFAVDLDDYIRTSGIKAWIYGHSHWNIETHIGNTLCTSNQLGYVHHNEQKKFDRFSCIEV